MKTLTSLIELNFFSRLQSLLPPPYILNYLYFEVGVLVF